jgi:hypothetical protein
MGHQSKLKIAVLGSVSFLILGFLCGTSVASDPAFLDLSSHRPAYNCSESFYRSSFSIAAKNTDTPYGGGKLVVGGEFSMFPAVTDRSTWGGPLSGGTLLSFAKVPLNILFCVQTL